MTSATSYQCKVYLAGNTLELTSRTEPRLEAGNLIADWVTPTGRGHIVNWQNVGAITWRLSRPGGGLA